MHNQEAMSVLNAKLDEFRALDFAELERQIGEAFHYQMTGPSGVEYQVEIQLLWEQAASDVILVMGSVDDGGLRAFAPLTTSFVRHRPTENP
jgi:hypothetical protein